MKAPNGYMEWPIDNKHFCDEVVTDFIEMLCPDKPVARSNRISYAQMAFYYTYDSECNDVLVEIRWDGSNSVLIIASDISATCVAMRYAEWIKGSEDSSGTHPYKTYVNPICNGVVSVEIFKKIEEQ